MSDQVNQLIQQPSTDSLVELYSIDATALGGDVRYWTPGPLNGAVLTFGGISYYPVPVEASGFEMNGQGKMPTPQLKMMNTPIITALIIGYGDLIGATVTRIRTFKRFLDGQPNANSSAMMRPDIYKIDRKALQNQGTIIFELAAASDQQGVKLPRRQVLRICTYTYRRWVNNAWVMGTCPYTGSNLYKLDDTGTGDPTQDNCGRRVSSCKARFGASANLPTGAFPGASIT
jgi:lambda family phage minor tail protein L